MITLEPRVGGLAAAVNNASTIADVVTACRYLNERRISVFLRFAHEMNGWWSYWGMRPTAYRAAFRAVALGIADCRACSTTAMVWAPQVGNGYPWGLDIPLNNASFFVANPGYANLNMTELRLLDTNGDGQIAAGDEPYEPFYPGDDVVDWVGLSIYWAGRNYGEASEPYPQTFANGLQGLDYIDGATVAAPNFYQIYSESRNKPFCLAETGVMHIDFAALGASGNATRLLMKQNWWRQTISDTIFDQFPNYRSTWLFEVEKEDTIPGVVQDFSYTFDSKTRDAFKADLPSRIVAAGSTYMRISSVSPGLPGVSLFNTPARGDSSSTGRASVAISQRLTATMRDYYGVALRLSSALVVGVLGALLVS
ncbi:hypothetical protein HDU93_006939 [Gonapodya sp. JEL0774]|nr:hypothetical protein HDU93_006939 [Gonapodya sp. JEL0774]